MIRAEYAYVREKGERGKWIRGIYRILAVLLVQFT
jgi:hypothetical protein